METKISRKTKLDKYNRDKTNFVQLCWKCSKCTGKYGGCSWQRNFTPVDGWNAEETLLNISGKVVPTYKILGCPEFDQDTDEKCKKYLLKGDGSHRNEKETW